MEFEIIHSLIDVLIIKHFCIIHNSFTLHFQRRNGKGFCYVEQKITFILIMAVHSSKHNQFPQIIYVNIICRLCFVKLKLLLLAIEAKQGEGGDSKISINPRNNKIVANMVGFFMAQSEDEVKR